MAQISAQLLARGWMLATAESCTGGMIAAACTDLAGSSQWFERGFVTYSNAAKTELLGVPAALIAQHGAVSEPVARAMAEGAVAHAHAQVAVAVTVSLAPRAAVPTSPWAWCGSGGAWPAERTARSSALPGTAQRCALPRWPMR